MVMVKLSSPVTNIAGSVKGSNWREDKCGKHLQKNPRRLPKPTRQGNQVSWFSKALAFFSRNKSGYIDAQNNWWLWSYSHPITNKKGETVYLNPFTAFLSYNMLRQKAGLPMNADPDLSWRPP